jgi:hypothetical protein
MKLGAGWRDREEEQWNAIVVEIEGKWRGK